MTRTATAKARRAQLTGRARAVLRTQSCRGCRATEVPILDALCPLCLNALPAPLRARVEHAHSGGDVTARFAAEDAAAAWLRAA